MAGVHEVLTLTADHITHSSDWAVVFALLEAAGAGAKPPSTMRFTTSSHHQQHLLHMRSLPGIRSRQQALTFTLRLRRDQLDTNMLHYPAYHLILHIIVL